jgi:DNA mismatch endonuclease, patch repair protein
VIYGSTSSAAASARMASVRQRNTKPEVLLRQELRKYGIRYRIHDRRLPGTPDVVLLGSRIAVFVHGCFWHRHSGCSRATTPKSNQAFWDEKFTANERRDARNARLLRNLGWKVLIVWECALLRDPVPSAIRVTRAHLRRISTHAETTQVAIPKLFEMKTPGGKR